MKRYLVITTLVLLIGVTLPRVYGQCSVCTKTAMQLGEKPAQGLNQGILYLMIMPFAIVSFIGYRWWRGQKET